MPTSITLLKKKKMHDAVCFTGLPGIGLVGKIAVDYMLKQIKAEKIAEIHSDSFPPSITTFNGVTDLIKNEIYYFKFKKKDFLFIAGPVQPSIDLRMASGKEHYEFSESIVLGLKQLKVKEIYTLAGLNIGDKRIKTSPNVVVAATDEKTLKSFKLLGCKPATGEGLVSGAAGMLLGMARRHGLKGACLMGETSSKLVYGDHASAKKVIELLVKKFKFKINMKNIEKESKNIQQAFSLLVKQLESQPKEGEDSESNENPTYVR